MSADLEKSSLLSGVCVSKCTTLRYSTVVSIPACHAGDPGSIPGVGALFCKFSCHTHATKTGTKDCTLWDSNPRLQRRLRPERSALTARPRMQVLYVYRLWMVL